ncbi:hypothetical protein X975_19088, partial [Stegodyphus mimosarum]
MITSSIQEAGSLDELPQEEAEETSDSSNSTEIQGTSPPKPPLRKNNTYNALEIKIPSHGEWTNRILANAKESPMARSETNLMDALKSDSPIIPTRKSKFETLRHNLRRHTLQLAESSDLSGLTLLNNQKKNRSDSLKSESPRNNQSPIPEGIPIEVIQQYEKMNHKDLVYLAIKQQVD